MDALYLAKIIINKCSDKENSNLSITKLHKLFYIVYGTYLVLKGKPLFDNEEDKPACFEHWPIFKSVQREYKKGLLRLKEKYNDIEYGNEDTLINIINQAIDKFGGYSVIDLSNWTHGDGSAWSKAEKEDNYNWGNIIKDNYIKKEFKTIVRKWLMANNKNNKHKDIYKVITFITNDNPDENKDPDDFNELKKKHKTEISKLTHKITTNIYNFFILITNRYVLIISIVILIFFIMPFSKMNGFTLKDYLKYLLKALIPFGTFVLGTIISDWFSSKYKSDN